MLDSGSSRAGAHESLQGQLSVSIFRKTSPQGYMVPLQAREKGPNIGSVGEVPRSLSGCADRVLTRLQYGTRFSKLSSGAGYRI
jgi:hypothetical protein